MFLLSVWLLVSLFISAYWFFDPAEWFWAKHKYISAGIGIGAFFCCAIVIGLGVRYLLWFIPKDWTYETEEGEIRLVVSSIASLIGLCAAIFLGFLFDKVQKIRRENRDLCTELTITRKIERRRKELDFFEESHVKEAAAEFRQKLEELEALAETDSLKPAQEIERRVLLGLLNELEWRLESLTEMDDEDDELENGEDEQDQ